MNNTFLNLVDELKNDISSINTKNISKCDFDKKALTIKQKILYLKNSQVDEQYKKMCESSLMFVIELFKAKIAEFRKVELELKEQKRKQSERIIRGYSPNISTQDLESAVKNPTEYARLKILSNEPDSVIINKLKHVEEKYQDVLELEANIAELNQMFIDFALIVDKQGNLLDHIELGVKLANDYVKEGNEEMERAIEEAKKLRRKQLCLCCCCTLSFCVVGLIIFFVVYVHSGKI
jgi:t-SNARE complex subunit (syntaxin)